MSAGQVVERAQLQALFDDPQHPYMIGLLGSDAHCHAEAPPLHRLGPEHLAACWKAPVEQCLPAATALASGRTVATT